MSDTGWPCVKLHAKPIIRMDRKIFRSTPLCSFCHLVFLVMCSGPVVTSVVKLGIGLFFFLLFFYFITLIADWMTFLTCRTASAASCLPFHSFQ